MLLKIVKIFALLVLLALIFWGYTRFNDLKSVSNGSTSKNASVCPICGVKLKEKSSIKRPIAVMVENSPVARPQSGLKDACIVYEAVTEGGISRFMAVYLHNNAERIGPVRSARTHFIDLSRDYRAAYVHCGQSNEALSVLNHDMSVINVDQMKLEDYFWREKGRRAPHNLYTSTDNIVNYMKSQNLNNLQDDFPNFTYNSVLDEGTEVDHFEIDLSSATPKVSWKYDVESKEYTRYNGTKAHLDKETNEPLTAKNIIVQFVRSMPNATSNLGVIDVMVTGEGSGFLYSNGKRVEIAWQKPRLRVPTTYLTKYGDPIPLTPGITYVMLVDETGSTKSKK